jgi:hypothetical protein
VVVGTVSAARSRSRVARSSVAVAIAAVLAATAVATGAAPAGAQGASGPVGSAELSRTGAAALARLEACLRAEPRVGVALVIDETQTLRRSDPDRVRADALAQFVRRLREAVAATESDGVARELWLHVAFFGSDHAVWRDWAPLDAADAGFEDRLRDEIVRRDGARHTRFERAVVPTTAALGDLTLRLGGRGLCTIALWFSDGELDPDDRASLGPDRPAMREAVDELCRAGGAMDRFRAGGGVLVGLLLNVDLDPAAAPPLGMREMVEGDGPGGRCGTLPATGAFLTGGLDALLRAVERVAVGAPDLTPSGDPIRLEVEPGVDRVRIVGPAGNGIVVTTAAGRVLEAVPGGPGTGDLAPRSTVRWAGRTVSVDVAVAGDHGPWVVRRDGVEPALDVYLLSDLGLAVDRDRTLLLRGAPSTLAGRILRPDGRSPDLGVFGAVDVAVDVVGAVVDGAVEVAADGTFAVPVVLDGPAAALDVTLTLRLATGSGTTLQPVVARATLSVTLPEEFPTATPRGTRYAPAVQRVGDVATLTVDLVGSPLGPTRVCPRPEPGDDAVAVRVVAPAAVAGAAAGDGCLDLDAGATATVELEAELRAPSLDPREVAAPIVLRLVSAARADQPPLELDVRLDAAVPVDRTPPNRAVVALLLALGILVPWLLLWWLTDRAAVLSAPRGLRLAHVDAVLVPGAESGGEAADPRLLRRGPDGAPDPASPLVDGSDFGYPSGLQSRDSASGAARRAWTVAGGAIGAGPGPLGETVRAVRPGPLLRRPRAVVEAPAGMRIVTSIGRPPRGGALDRGRGRLVLDGVVHLLARDTDLRGPVDAPVPVRLTILLAAEGRTLDGRVVDLVDRLEDLVHVATLAALRDAAAVAIPAPGPTAPPGSPPGPGGPSGATKPMPWDRRPGAGPTAGPGPTLPTGPTPSPDPLAPRGPAAPPAGPPPSAKPMPWDRRPGDGATSQG